MDAGRLGDAADSSASSHFRSRSRSTSQTRLARGQRQGQGQGQPAQTQTQTLTSSNPAAKTFTDIPYQQQSLFSPDEAVNGAVPNNNQASRSRASSTRSVNNIKRKPVPTTPNEPTGSPTAATNTATRPRINSIPRKPTSPRVDNSKRARSGSHPDLPPPSLPIASADTSTLFPPAASERVSSDLPRLQSPENSEARVSSDVSSTASSTLKALPMLPGSNTSQEALKTLAKGPPAAVANKGWIGFGLSRSATMPSRGQNAQQTLHIKTESIPPSDNRPNSRQNIAVASSKITNFFGWKSHPQQAPPPERSPTTISDRSSPAHSPSLLEPANITSNKAQNAPNHIILPQTSNAQVLNGYFTTLPPTPTISVKLEEMEEELKDISTELADSIKREMELEDEVERLQHGGPVYPSREFTRRTSDYYSDSGTSSVRGTENDKSKHSSTIERVRAKLDFSEKLITERARARALEDHVRKLEMHIQEHQPQSGAGSSEQVQKLETALSEHRRRLSDEKKSKENVEELLKALRAELIQHKNERDNLRDEVVPQLRTRLEGLETETANAQKVIYENTRLQQEMQALKGGSATTILEDGPYSIRSPRLSQGPTMGGLSRSDSLSKKSLSKDELLERLKETETQRDALHQSLKGLIARQHLMTREHGKRIKTLETERNRAIERGGPPRSPYERDMKDLRLDVNALRKRAEDAIEQKWQCEKGLGGLKMDLDRAEAEVSSLRTFIKDSDASQPFISLSTSSSGSERSRIQGRSMSSTSDESTSSLQQAYDELTKAQTQLATLQAQADFHSGENSHLSSQLLASSDRVKHLSEQVASQLASNKSLRERLAEAISKGERDQRESTTRISSLQTQLKVLEERLTVTTTQYEDALARHEDSIRSLRKNSTPSIVRISRIRSPSQLSLPLKSPHIPSTPGFPLSPNPASNRLSIIPVPVPAASIPRIATPPALSSDAALKTEQLESRVRELEGALALADLEMEEVVSRMNVAQMEVATLSEARDEARMATRKLKKEIENAMGGVRGVMGLFGR